MLIKNSLLLLIGLSFSQASFATEFKSTPNLIKFATILPAQDLPLPLPPDDATTPVPPTSQDSPKPIGAFNFSDGKKLFDQGLLPTEQGLVGSWIIVGYADVSKDFAGMTDFYKPDGHTNLDGSKWGIAFGWQVKEITNEKYFFAQFFNWGIKNNNQGPYQARIDINRKAAITSIFANVNNRTSSSYYTFDCRQVHNNSDLTICGLTLKIVDPKTSPDSKVYDNVMGGMIVLKKSR